MPKPEGRSLPFVGPEHVDVGVLETFPYAGPSQQIVTETDEFSAVCPYSGLPDYATLTIRYQPAGSCIELKSLKYYITSYRNVGIFQEHATAKIAEDLFRVLAPALALGGNHLQRPRRIPHDLHGRPPLPRALIPDQRARRAGVGQVPRQPDNSQIRFRLNTSP